MDFTETELAQIENHPLLRRLYMQFLRVEQEMQIESAQWTVSRGKTDEMAFRLLLLRLRGEDTPDAFALEYQEALIAVRTHQGALDQAIKESGEILDLLSRLVVDLRAGREPKVPMKMVTTVQMTVDKVLASRLESSGEEE